MASKAGLRSLSLGLACLSLFLSPARGATHPLGNFSISHYTRIQITSDAIELHYLLDMAEIPTFQELQDTGLVADVHHPSVQDYLAQRAETLKTGLVLEVNGQRLALENVARDLFFPPGAGGLPTLKLGLVYRAPLRLAARDELSRLYYRDTNFPGRAGWQEIIAVADAGTTLVHSSVPAMDRSQALTTYPTDLLQSPPQVLQAQIFFTPLQSMPLLAAVTPSAPAAALPSNASQPWVPPVTGFTRQMNTPNTPRNAFTELITTPQLRLSVVCLALSVAVGLGAFHALEPGHGKTVVAAYLVGSRGTAWHAFSLGCIVTVTHTAGVYLLGLVTLYASRYVLPERLYPWLGAFSGLLIAGLGGWLLFQRYAERGHRSPHLHTHAYAHPHPHPHPHTHSPGHGHHHHHHHESGHGHHHHPEEPSERVSYRELLALGVTGGIVPCPAALVVLLSAIALQRVGFGLLLIAAFSVGLATVLIAIGLLMVYARRFMARFQGEGRLIQRWLPLTSAATITVFGLAMIVQALVAAGVLHLRL
jgi:ABC-type nickel/cobalt efflux system permease component RcnA